LNNDKALALIEANFWNDGQPLTKKSIKYYLSVASLEEVNNELKTDLENYIKYGAGNWTKFKKEFNSDLAFLDRNLKSFSYHSENLISQNSK